MQHGTRTSFAGGALAAAVFFLAVCGLDAAPPAYANTARTLDAGGGSQTARPYGNTGSVGGSVGLSTVTSPADVVRHGFIGQLYHPLVLALTANPAIVPEETSSSLGGTAVMDDDTLVVLDGAAIRWTGYDGPIQSVSTAGLLTAGTVLADTPAGFSGTYAGVDATGTLTVRDMDPDNYGLYAADLIPDAWQYLYFGLENPDAAPGRDPDGDGQNNRFEYVAGVVPIHTESRFRFRIEPVSGANGQVDLVFDPRWSSRTYTALFTSNLLVGSWSVLSNSVTADAGTARIVTDLRAGADAGFYRIRISLPGQ